MGEFKGNVERILRDIIEKSKDEGRTNDSYELPEGIDPEELPVIVEGSNPDGSRRPVNCYPGMPSNQCFDTAYFFALGKPYIRTKRGNYTCRIAIEKVVLHMQGYCPDKTRYAILVTDNWDKNAYDYWYYNLQRIKGKAYMEAYLVTYKGLTEIPL
jgi:hypothetical protein